MSGLSINNPPVMRPGYQLIESYGPTLVTHAPKGGGIKVPNALVYCDELRYRVNKQSAKSQILDRVFGCISPLARMLGWQRPNIAPRVPFVPKPEVQPDPVPATTGPQANPLPVLSSKRDGAKADDIFGGFRQGPGGNCVTVSAIKVAMAKFGQSPTDIFKEVRKERDGYQVTMRDAYSLFVSQQELSQGARASRFVGRDKEVLKDAHFLFAVSAKRAQLENNDGTAKRSFTHALRSLNNGEDEYGPGEGLLRLGLSRHIERVPVSKLADGELGMVNRRGHSAAVINGVEESYGKRGRSPRHGEALALR
ncbi:hypothetical protein [Pseudomonas graminis]